MGGIHAEERAHAVKYELGSVLCRGSTGYSDLGGSNAHTRARAPMVLVMRGWFMGRGRGRLEGKWWYTRATRVNRRSRLMMIPGVPIIDVRMNTRKTSQDRVE